MTTLACSPAAVPAGPSPGIEALFPAAASQTAPLVQTATLTAEVAPPRPPCHSDADCGYDPSRGQCGTDPRFNKQPPLVDQGLVCYCDPAATCTLLRVDPAPCEGDKSCAVRLDPRPHPIRAGAEHPYQKPRSCRAPKKTERGERDHFVTCERTNICTMHARECAPR